MLHQHHQAKRRYEELKAKGQEIPYEQILADVKDRDYNDSTRAFAPLKQTEDSILVDSSNMTIDEVANLMLDVIKNK